MATLSLTRFNIWTYDYEGRGNDQFCKLAVTNSIPAMVRVRNEMFASAATVAPLSDWKHNEQGDLEFTDKNGLTFVMVEEETQAET
jgi:hypothetical protein